MVRDKASTKMMRVRAAGSGHDNIRIFSAAGKEVRAAAGTQGVTHAPKQHPAPHEAPRACACRCLVPLTLRMDAPRRAAQLACMESRLAEARVVLLAWSAVEELWVVYDNGMVDM